MNYRLLDLRIWFVATEGGAPKKRETETFIRPLRPASRLCESCCWMLYTHNTSKKHKNNQVNCWRSSYILSKLVSGCSQIIRMCGIKRIISLLLFHKLWPLVPLCLRLLCYNDNLYSVGLHPQHPLRALWSRTHQVQPAHHMNSIDQIEKRSLQWCNKSVHLLCFDIYSICSLYFESICKIPFVHFKHSVSACVV